MSDQYTIAGGELVKLTPHPHEITFMVDGGEWAIRITKDGVVSNPNVNVDDGAKAIFEALKPYLQSLK